MIDISKLNRDVPDDITVDVMRKRIVDIIDTISKSNADEESLIEENKRLSEENARLAKQNLDLFNRVTTPIVQKFTEKTGESVTTEEIVDYYK